MMLAIALVAALGQPALAHSAGATVSFDPAAPAPGQMAKVVVKMLDAYGAVIPATVRASVSAIDEPATAGVPLVEQPAGIHTVQLRFPQTVGALLRLEVTLPDGLTRGQLMFRVGEGGFPVQDVPVDLVHDGETTDNGKPYAMPPAIPVAPQPAPGQATPTSGTAPATPPARTVPWAALALVGGVMAVTWVLIRRRR
jgi:hypothetical protein